MTDDTGSRRATAPDAAHLTRHQTRSGAPQVTAGAPNSAPLPGPVPLSQAIAELLGLSNERDTWMLRIRGAWRDALALGYELGHAAGRAEAEQDMADSWREVARPIARGGGLQQRRWAVHGRTGGREDFARPCPGDYPGQEGAE